MPKKKGRPKNRPTLKVYRDDPLYECTGCERMFPDEAFYRNHDKRAARCKTCDCGVEFDVVVSLRDRPVSLEDQRLNEVFANFSFS